MTPRTYRIRLVRINGGMTKVVAELRDLRTPEEATALVRQMREQTPRNWGSAGGTLLLAAQVSIGGYPWKWVGPRTAQQMKVFPKKGDV